MPLIHKIGVALTILLAVVGFWDVKAVWEHDLFEHVAFPILGIIVVTVFLKIALNRSAP